MSDRASIESIQIERLQSLIAELQDGNEFYQARLREAGVDPAIASLEEFTRRMPFTTRMDLERDREKFPPYGSNRSYPFEAYSRFCQSSGTTSVPVPSLDTAESWSSMLDCWDRIYDAAGVEKTDIVFFAFSFAPFLGFWTAFDAAVRRGNLSIPGGGLSTLARVQAIVTHRVTVLCCTPTYAIRLGEILSGLPPCECGGLSVKTIIVAGEPGGSIPGVRSRITELWGGARVFDHHGMTEVGPISYEAPSKPRCLCVIEEAYFAEILDQETGREVAPGKCGELVITNLTRKAQPLLRYRTGDLVRKSYLEENGRSILSLDGGILGRVDDMVVVRGVNIHPTAVESVLRQFPEVAEFQIIQTTRQSMAELEITVEPREPMSFEQCARLGDRIGAALTNAFTLRIPVFLVNPGSLPRFEFKSKRWIRRD